MGKNILVSYTSGYNSTNIPRVVKELAAKLVAIDILQYTGQLMSQGQISISAGGANANFGSVPYEGRINLLRERTETIYNELREFTIM